MLNAVKYPFLLVIKGFFLFAELSVRMTKVIRHPVKRKIASFAKGLKQGLDKNDLYGIGSAYPIEMVSQLTNKNITQELLKDHARALERYRKDATSREACRSRAFQIHVSCMDERAIFASDATGEPIGSMELFASPGGKVTADALIRLYGARMEEAQRAGKEIAISLMPHRCGAESHAGCAAFQTDEDAQEAYFSRLATDLAGRRECEGARIFTAFYDTDTHELRPFYRSRVSPEAQQAAERLQREEGMGGAEKRGEWDRQHAGHRVYIGTRYRAWIARRNVAFHLSSGLRQEEVFEGIALAITIMKTHSHVNLQTTPIVIHLDQTSSEEDVISLTDEEIIKRVNLSSRGRWTDLSKSDMLILRTRTHPETWEGTIV